MTYQPASLPEIDVVEIVDLKGLQPDRVNEYMRMAKNAPFTLIEGENAQKIACLWRHLPHDEQMRCHMPPFGLRFYLGKQLLIEGSVCWECNNIFVVENDEDVAYTFDAQHPYSQELLSLLRQLSD
jgi:hypothetical protein